MAEEGDELGIARAALEENGRIGQSSRLYCTSLKPMGGTVCGTHGPETGLTQAGRFRRRTITYGRHEAVSPTSTSQASTDRIPTQLGEDLSADKNSHQARRRIQIPALFAPQRAPRCDRAPCRSTTPAGRADETAVSAWRLGRPASQRAALDGSTVITAHQRWVLALILAWLWRSPRPGRKPGVVPTRPPPATGAIAADAAVVLVVY
ncbi:hypothetical protein V501_05703 [Pseudogymnoascus sp. VKM F-4519 (FW-2642)]|nr:hypothetical protein V501_05703 [Pseudogymnoascus sp. VKM F-4519 (FW-2642)]